MDNKNVLYKMCAKIEIVHNQNDVDQTYIKFGITVYL
jgi:hypothetical protein